jgi:hypothetical protein
MAENSNALAIGTVKAIVGEVRATGADGVVRILVEGDTVSAGEVIETSANGAVHIQLVNGRALECGPQFSGALTQNLLDLPSGTRIALDGSIHHPIFATTPAPDATSLALVTPSTSSPQDIAALQAAIAGGADPSQVADASAAGGAPGSGGTQDGGGGTPLIIEQANSRGEVTSGIKGGAFTPPAFPDLTTQQVALIQPTEPDSTPPEATPPPTISVDIPGIRLAPLPPGTDGESADSSENVTVSGNIVSLVEGTSAGADPGMILNFVLVLDKPSEVDIKVSYTITALGVENDIDLVDLLGGSITIPAGNTQILVPIRISQDHNVELNEAFKLAITSATNAVIDPAGSTAILNILNDDFPPVASNDAYTADEGENGATLFSSVLSHVDEFEANDDSGADAGESLTVTTTGAINTAQGGHVLMNTNGTFHYFAPSEEFNGSDSFLYRMTDGFNGESEAVVTIIVAPVDDVPDAVDNAYSVNEDSTLIITAPGLLGNDTTGGDGGALAVTSFTQPAHGSLDLNGDGSFIYTPTANYNGPDSFSYTIKDADGDADTAIVTIMVGPVNDVPNAVNDTYSVDEGSTLTITAPGLLGNDTTGGDGGTLAVYLFTQPVHGSLTLNGDGSFTYTPMANYNGTDYFSYTIKDADGDADAAIVNIIVSPVNDVPDAVDNAYNVNEDSTLTITAPGLLGNDTTGGDGGALAVTSYTQPAHGSLDLNGDGSFTYTPTANYNGPDSFSYTIKDADGDADTATVTIMVGPVNDVPTLNVTSASGEVFESALPGGSGAPETESAQAFQALSTTLPTSTTGSLQVGDPDGLDSVTHLNIKGIDYAVDILADGEIVTGNNGTLAISYNALSGIVSYEYTLTQPAFDAPDADEQDIFEVKVKDNTGLYSAPAAISINIHDDVPTIIDLFVNHDNRCSHRTLFLQ